MPDKTLNLDEIVGAIQNTKPSEYIKNSGDSNINQYLASPHFNTNNSPLVKTPQKDKLDPFWDNEFKAINQTWAEDWANGLGKFGGSVLINTVGNLAGLVYGIPKAIVSGELRQFYDNEFMHLLDNMDEQLKQSLPNYVTKEESEYGLLKSMGTRAFWANDFLGGLSFTTSAVLSEIIASGVTAATFGAGASVQAGLTSRLLSKATKATRNLTKVSKIADVPLKGLGRTAGLENAINQSLKFGRQFVTGAGYEAGVEARHFINEAKEAYILDYVTKFGKEPSEEQIANRMSSIHDTANALFAGNLILVGFGNMLTLPRTFGINTSGAFKQIQQRGLTNFLSPTAAIKDIEKNATKWSMAYDKWNKMAKVGYMTGSIAKRPLHEGLVEEGGQNLMKRASLNYVAQGYSSDGANNAYTIWDSLMDAFDQTYGDSENKEFRKEVAIGMLIGLVGAPGMQKGNVWQGSALNAYRDTKKQLETAQEYINMLNTNDITPFLKSSMKNYFSNYETNKEIEAAINNGDMFRAKSAENSQLFSSIKSRYDIGMIDTIKDDIITSFDELSEEAFAISFGFENMTKEELSDKKDKMKSQMLDKVDSVKSSIEQAKKITRGRALKGETEFLDNEDLDTALAYAIESSKNLDLRESEMAPQLAQNLGTDVETILEAAKLSSRIKFSKTWISKYEASIRQLEIDKKSKEKNLEKLTQNSAINRNEKQVINIQKEIDKLDNKIEKQNQKIYSMIGDKFMAEKTKLASNYFGENYNYNIDDFEKAVKAIGDVHSKYNDKYKTNPEISEESFTLYEDLKKIAEQRMYFTKEIQSLISREGAKAFKDDLEEIKKDAFKISKDELINRYKRSLAKISFQEGNLPMAQDLIQESEENVTTSDDVAKIQDIDNEQFNTLKTKALEAERAYDEAPKTLDTVHSHKNKLNSIIKALEESKKDETSEDNINTIDTLIQTLNNRVEILNASLADFNQAKKEGDVKILNSVNSFIRVIVSKEREAEVLEHLKKRNKKFMYDFLTIKKEKYDKAGEVVLPRNEKGEEITGPISIRLGDGKDSGYQLYDGDFLIGGITRPDRYLYDGMPLDITNDAHIKALGITDLEDFRAYYVKVKELFDKIDNGEEVSGKELGQVIRFKFKPSNFDKAPNDDTGRPLLIDFAKDPSNHITIGGNTGLLIRRGSNYYLYNEDFKEPINVTSQVGDINSKLKTETLAKIKAQYLAIIENNTGGYMTLALDYPKDSEYSTEDIVNEIKEAEKALTEGLSEKQLEKLGKEKVDNLTEEELNKLVKERLDDERGASTIVYRPLDMFITLKNKNSKTSNLHIDARIQRSYNKKKDEYSKPYITFKVSGTWHGAPTEYIEHFITERNGEYFVSLFKNVHDDKASREPLTKQIFLEAFNDRLYSKRKGKLGKLLADTSGSMIVEAVNIKKRVEVNNKDLGSLELAVIPNTNSKPYYIEPNKKIFDDVEVKEKVKQVVVNTKVSTPSRVGNFKEYSRDFDKGLSTLERYPYGTILAGRPVITRLPIKGKMTAIASTEQDVNFTIRMNLNLNKDPFQDRLNGGIKYYKYDLDTTLSLGYRITEDGMLLKPDGTPFNNSEGVPGKFEFLKQYYKAETVLKEEKQETLKEEVKEDAKGPEVTTKPNKEASKDLFDKLSEREENPSEEEDDDYAFSTLKDESFPITSLQEAIDILSKILPIKTAANPDGLFSIKEIAELKDALRKSNVPFGAFHQSVIYLDQNRATKGTAYHEAFHAVYRVLTTESERAKVLKEAKATYSAPTKAEINNLRASHPSYSTKSDSYLTDLYYEEKMADDFADKATAKPKSFLGKLFDKIKNWIKSLVNISKDDLSVYFDKILQGQYKTADSVREDSDVAFSFFKILPRTSVNGVTIPPRTSLTESETDRLISRTVSNVLELQGQEGSLGADINKAIEHLREYYSYDNWKSLLNALPNQQAANNAIAMLTDINAALRGKDNLNKLRMHVSKIVQTLDADIYDEEEDNDTPESYNDNYIGENNGFKTLSQEVKAFFMTLEYPGDEFNLGLTQEWIESNQFYMPINVYKTYFNVQKALTDVKPIQMLNRLKYLSKDNAEMGAVYNGVVGKIKKETGIDKSISEYTLAELEKSNFFNSFVTNFSRTRLDIRNVLYNPASGEFRIISANQKDAAKTQVTEWYERYQLNLNNLSNADIADSLKALKNIYYPSEKVDIGVMVGSIEDIIKSIKSTLRTTVGISLSEEYIKWSWINDNLEALTNHYAYLKELEQVSPIEFVVKEMLEFHEAFNTGINSLDQKIEYKNTKEVLGTMFQLLPSEQILASNIVNNRNPFGLNQTDVDADTNEIVSSGGARTRLFNIAAANAVFDPTVRPTSYQNIEGKNIWDVVNKSFYFDMYSLFKTAEFKDYITNIKESNWQDLDNVLKDNDMYYPSHLVKLYHQSNLNNPLLSSVDVNELFSQDKLLSSIGGIRETAFREDGKIDTKKDFQDGKTWKHMDYKSKLVSAMSYYANQDILGDENESQYTRYNWNVNEGKSTTLLATLPKYNTVTNGKLSKTAISHLTKLFKGEFDKIAFETRNIGKNDAFRVEGYNYDSKTKTNSFKDNPNLRAFKFNTFAYLEDIDKATHDELLTRAREGNPISEDELFDKLEPIFQAVFTNIKEELISTLEGQDFRMLIKTKEGDEYRVDGLPKYFKNGSRLNEDRLLEFIVNDYINSVSFNTLLDIDGFFGKKDFVDFVKRNAGKIAYGPSLGTGQTKIAIISNVGNELIKEVDDTDAQSYSTESWEYNTYLKSLGKIPNNKVKKALQKKRKGYTLDEDEIRILKFYKAMGQSKKLVSYDHMIYMKTSVMPLQRSMTSYVEKHNRVVLDGLYDKLFELEENNSSFKDKESVIKEINSKWKALPNKKRLHDLLNKMELQDIGIVSFDSAIKGAKVNVSQVNSDGSVVLNPVTMNNKFLREQVTTDGFKTSIVHGTQLMQLIWSEQNDDTEVNYKGKNYKLSSLRTVYKSLIADRIRKGRVNLEGTIFEKAPDGKLTKPVYKELYKSFKKSVESSNPSPYLQELFATDINGNPEYDPNFTGVSAKFFNMFMAYASADVMKHKTKGAKYTLASDFGHELLVDAEGKVIKLSDIRNQDGTINYSFLNMVKGTRRLEYKDGVAEAIVSANVSKLYKLKPGDEIPAHVAKQLGFRIPTQDKHSMIRLKIVDILPAETMSTIIVHPKVIELSGADFDIDSLFARLKETYQGKEFGNYLETENVADAILEKRNSKEIVRKLELFLLDTRFKSAVQIMEEFGLEEMESKINSEIVKNEVKKQYEQAKEQFYMNEGLYLDPEVLRSKNAELYRTIINNINNSKAGNLELIQPITKEETNNMLFEIEYELIHNEGNKEIAETPASFKSIDDTLAIWKENGLDYSTSSKRSHDIMTRLNSIRANDAGNAGIGPAALANVAIQNLISSQAKVINSILKKGKFVYKTDDGTRVNDLVSTVISAMTDNAKHLYSSQFNMNVNTVSFATTMFGLGFNSLFTYSGMRTKSFEAYSQLLERVNSPLTSRGIRSKLRGILKKPDKLLSELLKLQGNSFDLSSLLASKIKLTEDNLLEALKYEKGLESKLKEKDYYAIQAKFIKDVLIPIKQVNEEIRTYTRVLSLIKGFKANPAKINSIFEDLESLGVKVEYSKNNVEIKTIKTKEPTKLNWTNIITENPYVEENIKTAGKIKAFLGEFLIAFSPMGEDIVKSATIHASNNRFDNDEKMMAMIRDFSSYIMLKKYKADKGKEYSSLDLFDRSLIDEHRKLLKETEDITSPLYNNVFLNALTSTAKGVNAAKVYSLIMNTRSLKSKDITSSLMDGFRVLVAYPQYREFAQKLIEQLIMKDALVYRNNSYLSSIDPHILRNVIKPLSELVKVFSEGNEESLKKLLKNDVNALKKEFSELYLLDSANFKERRSTDTGFLMYARQQALEIISERVGGSAANKEGYDPIRITYDSNEKGPKRPVKITFNGRAGINPNVFKSKNKEKIKEERAYIQELYETMGMSNAANSSSYYNENGTLVQSLGFPLGFQITYTIGKNNEGENITESKLMVLKRVSRNPFKQEWEDPTMVDGRYLIPGLEAEFEILEGSNYGLFSTMAYNSEILKEDYKAIEELRNAKQEEMPVVLDEKQQKAMEEALKEATKKQIEAQKAAITKKFGSLEAYNKQMEEKTKNKRRVMLVQLPDSLDDLEKDTECNN